MISSTQLLEQTWFVPERIKQQTEDFSDDIEQDVIIRSAMRCGGQNFEVIDSQADRECTVNNNDGSAVANEKNAVDIRMLEINVTDRITKGTGNVVKTVEDRIQNAISAGLIIIIIPRIEMMGQ